MPPYALRLGLLGPVKVRIVEIVYRNHTNEFNKNNTKNRQESIQNQAKIHQESSQIKLLGALGASCEALGEVLGASALQKPTSHQKARSVTPPGPPSWTQNPPKIH